MSWDGDLKVGLAAYLAGQGVGTHDPGTPMEQQPDGAIGVGALMDKPDVQVGIQTYNQQPDATVSDVVQPVQFMIRGDDATVDTIAGAIFTALHARRGLTIGGIPVSFVYQYTDIPQGVDQNNRRLRSVNYYLEATRPTVSRSA